MIALALQSSTPEVSIHGGKVVTTSIAVADYFHKRHDDVLKKIRALVADCDQEWYLRNFAEASRKIPQPNGGTATYKCFELTRDAFVLIVMGFTGKRALQWKIRYIEAFNAMEEQLRQQQTPPAPSWPPFSDDYPNRTEIIYYHEYRAYLHRILRPEEMVITPESLTEWLEMRGLMLFTREDLESLTIPQLLKKFA